MTDNYEKYKLHLLNKYNELDEGLICLALSQIDNLIKSQILQKARQIYNLSDNDLTENYLKQLVLDSIRKVLQDNLKNENYKITKTCSKTFFCMSNLCDVFIPDFMSNFDFTDYIVEYGNELVVMQKSNNVYGNKESLKYHKPMCPYVPTNEEKRIYFENKIDAENAGYKECQVCFANKPLFVGNKANKSLHNPNCTYAPRKADKRIEFFSNEEAIKSGYKACSTCNPKLKGK